MLFNSYIFVFLFLPIAILGYFLLNKLRKYKVAETFLISMSLVFYGYFNAWYLLIIVFSILINYFIVILMNKYDLYRKYILSLGLVFNIGLLFYFKYMDFFISSINDIFNTSFELMNILLPLGISFFTFQQLSYLIDSYLDKGLHYEFREYDNC